MQNLQRGLSVVMLLVLFVPPTVCAYCTVSHLLANRQLKVDGATTNKSGSSVRVARASHIQRVFTTSLEDEDVAISVTDTIEEQRMVHDLSLQRSLELVERKNRELSCRLAAQEEEKEIPVYETARKNEPSFCV